MRRSTGQRLQSSTKTHLLEFVMSGSWIASRLDFVSSKGPVTAAFHFFRPDQGLALENVSAENTLSNHGTVLISKSTAWLCI